MNMFRPLLAGSIAALGLSTGAFAADQPIVPMAAAEPAGLSYVIYCETMGTGFFFIPGTDTCLKIGGYVRADYNYREQVTYTGNDITTRARARLNFDARTDTELGTVRSFAQIEFTNDNAEATTANLEKAFITFAGFTAGRAASFFDFVPNEGILLFQRVSERNSVNLFAYEAKFDQFKAAVSLEENVGRRLWIPANNNAGHTSGTDGNRGYGGQEWPDVVARISYEGAWGSAQLSGALHEVKPSDAAVDPEWGYAIQGGVKILLPFIEAGDFVNFHAAYSEGALSYLGYDFNTNRVSNAGSLGAANASVIVADGVVTPGDDLELSSGYTLAANFRHFWIAGQLRSNFAVSYTEVEQTRVTGNTLRDFNEIVASGNLIWTPSRALQMGPEVQYRRIDREGTATAPARLKDDEWAVRFRIQRDF